MRQHPLFTAPTYIVLLAVSALLISIFTVQTDDTDSYAQAKYLVSESQDDGPDGDGIAPCPVIEYRPLLGRFDAQVLSHIISKRESRLSSAKPILSSHLDRAHPV